MADVKSDSSTVQLQVSADGKKDWRDITAPVESVHIEDNDTLTDVAKVTLDDATGLLSQASYEGLRMRVGLGYGSLIELIFEGIVTSARITTTPDGQKIELTAQDLTYLMTKYTPAERAFGEGKRLSTAVEEIVMDKSSHEPYGLVVKQVEPPVDTSFTDEKKLIQRNQNDWQFLYDLAKANQCKVFVEFDGLETSKFYFVSLKALAEGKPIATLSCCRWGGELITFNFEKVAAGALKDVTASAVDFDTGQTVTTPPPPRGPRPETSPPKTDGRTDVGANQKKAVEALVELSAAADKELVAKKVQAAGVARDPSQTKAAVELDPTRSQGFRGNGVARGNTKLRAKCRLTILGIAPWAEGDWYLRKVEHKFTRTKIQQKYQNNYVTTFEVTR